MGTPFFFLDDGKICPRPPLDEAELGRVGESEHVVPGMRTTVELESTSSTWTDEKHSLYLNFMEESFVKELYRNEVCSSDSDGRRLKTEKVNSSSTSKFKVQRRGCWKEHNFERQRGATWASCEIRILSSNAWIRHFQSPLSGCRRGETCYDETQSLNKLPSCKEKYNLDLLDSYAEVSDQNFVNEKGVEEDQEIKTCVKKTKNTVVDDSTQAQSLPHEKPPEPLIHDENIRKRKGVVSRSNPKPKS